MSFELTWSNVTIGSSNGVGRTSEIAIIYELGKPEISNVRFKFKANENIVGLYVPVNNWRNTVMV